MIVNLQSDGWEIIYHRAHALLAAQIAGHWDLSKKTYRLYETIAAIAHHDNLEKEWEENQLTEAGAPARRRCPISRALGGPADFYAPVLSQPGQSR
jgi:hypothetical protein